MTKEECQLTFQSGTSNKSKATFYGCDTFADQEKISNFILHRTDRYPTCIMMDDNINRSEQVSNILMKRSIDPNQKKNCIYITENATELNKVKSFVYTANSALKNPNDILSIIVLNKSANIENIVSNMKYFRENILIMCEICNIEIHKKFIVSCLLEINLVILNIYNLNEVKVSELDTIFKNVLQDRVKLPGYDKEHIKLISIIPKIPIESTSYKVILQHPIFLLSESYYVIQQVDVPKKKKIEQHFEVTFYKCNFIFLGLSCITPDINNMTIPDFNWYQAITIKLLILKKNLLINHFSNSDKMNISIMLAAFNVINKLNNECQVIISFSNKIDVDKFYGLLKFYIKYFKIDVKCFDASVYDYKEHIVVGVLSDEFDTFITKKLKANKIKFLCYNYLNTDSQSIFLKSLNDCFKYKSSILTAILTARIPPADYKTISREVPINFLTFDFFSDKYLPQMSKYAKVYSTIPCKSFPFVLTKNVNLNKNIPNIQPVPLEKNILPFNLNIDSSFESLHLNDKLLSGIKICNFFKPLTIQLNFLPLILNGFSTELQAPRNSGKSSTAIIASLQILDSLICNVQVILITPSTFTSAKNKLIVDAVGCYLNINSYLINEDDTFITHVNLIRNKSPQYLLGTPHLIHKLISSIPFLFKHVKLLIFDGADVPGFCKESEQFFNVILDLFSTHPQVVTVN